MTKERIEDMGEVILPFVVKRLLETNYEGMGESDAEEFTRDFNEILDLAKKGLAAENPVGEWLDIPKYTDLAWQCSECNHFSTIKHKYCPDCGIRMNVSENQ